MMAEFRFWVNLSFICGVSNSGEGELFTESHSQIVKTQNLGMTFNTQWAQSIFYTFVIVLLSTCKQTLMCKIGEVAL